MRVTTAITFCALLSLNVFAGILRNDPPSSMRLPACGALAAPPFAPQKAMRPCGNPVSRSYIPKFHGLGYEILNSESDACFVPDDQFMLLDSIVEDATHQLKVTFGGSLVFTPDTARTISKAIGDVLERHAFALFIPTDALTDALVLNGSGASGFRTFDCDTSSFIYLTVAENIGLPLSMVEITLASGDGHNYVRWNLEQSGLLDWDTNGRAECRTPDGVPANQGRSMKRTEVLGYALALRSLIWERQQQFPKALADLRLATEMYPDSGLAHNNFAWLVATKEFDGRSDSKQAALQHAERAVALLRNPNRLDTLACAAALNGNFARAIQVEREALALGGPPSLQESIVRFQRRQDCTGME